METYLSIAIDNKFKWYSMVLYFIWNTQCIALNIVISIADLFYEQCLVAVQGGVVRGRWPLNSGPYYYDVIQSRHPGLAGSSVGLLMQWLVLRVWTIMIVMVVYYQITTLKHITTTFQFKPRYLINIMYMKGIESDIEVTHIYIYI